ncbi:MAG: type VII toxin-antitoxin system MntA family adenylyltransferase antitoxin [Promethearchaeota archaeon]
MGEIEAEKLDLIYIKEQTTKVFEKHPEIMIAYLYGSIVQKRTHKYSDIDIGIVLSPKIERDPLYSNEIQIELEEILNQITNRIIDVRVLNDSSPRFLNQAVYKGFLIYCADEDFKNEYELQVLHDYFDFKPILDMFENNYLKLNLGEKSE